MKNFYLLIVLIFIIPIFIGCEESLNDTLVDKETDDDINPITVDFNYFSTNMSVKLIDAKTRTQILKEAKITFTGSNGGDIATFSGEKKNEFYTSEGQLELTFDPNITITENSPVEFAVNVEIDGYNSFAKGIQIQSEGSKTFELYLIKVKDGGETNLVGSADLKNGDTTLFFSQPTPILKSAMVCEEKPYSIDYAVSVNDLLKFKDGSNNYIFGSLKELIEAYENNQDNFVHLSVTKFDNHHPGIELFSQNCDPENVLFQKLESGQLINLIVNDKVVADLNGGVVRASCVCKSEEHPIHFGFVNFEDCSWNLLGNEIVHDDLDFNFILAKVIDKSLYKKGANIKFSSDVKSNFSIDAEIYDNEDHFISSLNFRGDFPENCTLENIPQRASKIEFKNNNPAFASIPDIENVDLCSGIIKVDVSANEGYGEFQVALKVLCPDNPAVAIAPSFNAEYKLKDSENDWQGITLKGGKANILALLDREYQLRFLWEDEWKYSGFSTKVDNDGNYKGNSEVASKIHSEKMEDGRVRINIEKMFDESFCGDLGW